MFLIGNKDLAIENPDRREITSEYAENFCKENNFPYMKNYNERRNRNKHFNFSKKNYYIHNEMKEQKNEYR